MSRLLENMVVNWSRADFEMSKGNQKYNENLYKLKSIKKTDKESKSIYSQ